MSIQATELREALAALTLAARNVTGHVTLHNLQQLQKAQLEASALLDQIASDEKATDVCVWTFKFTDGDVSHVWAISKEEAIAAARAEFQRANHIVDVTSFHNHGPKKKS